MLITSNSSFFKFLQYIFKGFINTFNGLSFCRFIIWLWWVSFWLIFFFQILVIQLLWYCWYAYFFLLFMFCVLILFLLRFCCCCCSSSFLIFSLPRNLIKTGFRAGCQQVYHLRAKSAATAAATKSSNKKQQQKAAQLLNL